VGALAASTGALGCAEEREAINRVQPNALAKSFFVGDLADNRDNPKFWAQGTIVDVGFGAAQDGLFTSTYAQPVSVVQWQITEDLLIGRVAYERVNDSDGKAGLGSPTGVDEGPIAYIYPITSHFDIRRDYNPTTGEESNVNVENTTDLPWNERKFMRVDWSRNLNTDAFDYDTLSLMGIYGGVTYEPVSYYVNDPKHEDAPVFSTEDGYFDVTNKALATPGMIDLSHLGWGIDAFPACYLDNDILGGSAPAGNCNPVELTLRQAFRRVVDEDYEPQDWNGVRFQQFGAFTADRVGYAQNYGMVDQKWHRFIARYNIWERSHYYADPEKMTGAIECNTPATTPFGADPHRDEDAFDINNDKVADGNGTEDECEAVTTLVGAAGSRCDEFSQKCTLPYQVRTSKPVVWNYSKNSDQNVFDGTVWATNEWDVAFRASIQAAKYAECTKTNSFNPELVLGEDGKPEVDANGIPTQRTKLTGDGNNDGMLDICQTAYPLYNGQQEDNVDAADLAHEVDLCRHAFNPAELSAKELAAKDAECVKIADTIGAKRNYSAGVIAIAKMPEAVVICHGPVEANDPLACAPADKRLPKGVTAAQCDEVWNSQDGDAELIATCNAAHVARIGDLRYHQINSIRTPQTPSPWGIMTDSVDPTNGFKIAASINIWTHVNDLWSQGVVDMIRYIQGELPTESITDGKYVSDWAAASEAGSKNGALGTMTREQADQKLGVIAFEAEQASRGRSDEELPTKEELGDRVAAARGADGAVGLQPATPARDQLKKTMAKLSHLKASATAPSQMRPVYQARRDMVRGTQTEAALLNPAMQALGGVNPKAGLTSDQLTEFSSIFRGLNPQIRRDIKQAKENALAARGVCIMQEAPVPNSMVSLGNVLREKFGDWQAIGAGVAEEGQDPNDPALTVENRRNAHFERMRQFLVQRAQYAVIIHEMGHSVGLRHNFVSSSNAWGYRPQYWQLRTKNGTIGDGLDAAGKPANEFCTDLVEDGTNCVGPRYFDPPTDEESKQLIHMFMQSSVMDYAGEASQDLIGLGAYDFAATRAFYGETMAVHADPSYGIREPRGLNILNITDTFGGIVGYVHQSAGQTAPAGDVIHYSRLNREYGLINDCYEVNPGDYEPTDWDEGKNGVWSPLLDGQIVQVDGKYTRCHSQKVDYVDRERLRRADATEASPTTSFYGGGPAIDPYGRTRVPYAFASDNWADLGNLAVYRHDNGADPYEVFNFFITEQETRHIFDNYRRDRSSFSVRSASNRILERYNTKMRDGAKGLGLILNSNRGSAYDDTDPIFASLATFYPENVLGAGIAFDHFARQLARPQSGIHVMGSANGSPVMRYTEDAPGPTASVLVVPDGATGRFGNVGIGGKLLENRLSTDNGDYDVNYTMNAGSYYDKVYAPYLLTESVDNFVSDSLEDFVDARYRSVSMADMFPSGFRRLIGNMMTKDDSIKGPRVQTSSEGRPMVEPQSRFPVRPIGWTSWWMPEPEVCFPATNSIACAAPGVDGGFGGEDGIVSTVALDPQVGWEEWKFLVVQTMLYLPENAKNYWLDQLGVWEIGADSDPGFDNRIELHSPEGRTYVARTYGRETIFGKNVERGISSRVLEQANEFLSRAYCQSQGAFNPEFCTIEGPGAAEGGAAFIDADEDGQPDRTIWYVPILDENNQPTRRGTDATVLEFTEYEALPTFIRQTMQDFRMADPTMKGIYD